MLKKDCHGRPAGSEQSPGLFLSEAAFAKDSVSWASCGGVTLPPPRNQLKAFGVYESVDEVWPRSMGLAWLFWHVGQEDLQGFTSAQLWGG